MLRVRQRRAGGSRKGGEQAHRGMGARIQARPTGIRARASAGGVHVPSSTFYALQPRRGRHTIRRAVRQVRGGIGHCFASSCALFQICLLLALTSAAASGEPHVPNPTSYELQLRRVRQPHTRGGLHGGGPFTMGGAACCADIRIPSLLALTAAAASGEPHVPTPTSYGLQLRRGQQPRPRSVSHAIRPRKPDPHFRLRKWSLKWTPYPKRRGEAADGDAARGEVAALRDPGQLSRLPSGSGGCARRGRGNWKSWVKQFPLPRRAQPLPPLRNPMFLPQLLERYNFSTRCIPVRCFPVPLSAICAICPCSGIAGQG